MFSDLEQTLYDSLLRGYLLKYLDTDGEGRIKATAANYTTTTQIDRIIKKKIQPKLDKVGDLIITGVGKTERAASSYIVAAKPNAKLNPNATRKAIYNALGYSVTKKAIVEGGPLQSALNGFAMGNLVKRSIHQAIAGTVAKETLARVLKESILEKSLIKRQVEQYVSEPFEKADRMASKKYAEQAGLKYMIYQGGLVRDSRDFCIARDGMAFTTEEVGKFGTPEDKFGGYTNKGSGEFQGKPPNYDPFRDLGGYNCRHHLNYISRDLFLELRPDYTPNEE